MGVAAVLCAAPLFAQDAGARLAQLELDRTRAEFDRARAEAQAQAAVDRARMASENAERLAAEARRRADAANARQRALVAEYERRRSANEAQSQARQSDADLSRRAAEQRVRAAEGEARRAEAQRPRTDRAREVRPSEIDIYAPRRRQAAPPKQPVARPTVAGRTIAMKEGVVLCQRERSDYWRCTGPVRVNHGDIEANRAVITGACGTSSVRDLGTVRGFRAFGCGFGLNPKSDAPGNRDVAALFGIDVPGRAIFRCPESIDAYCRSR